MIFGRKKAKDKYADDTVSEEKEVASVLVLPDGGVIEDAPPSARRKLGAKISGFLSDTVFKGNRRPGYEPGGARRTEHADEYEKEEPIKPSPEIRRSAEKVKTKRRYSDRLNAVNYLFTAISIIFSIISTSVIISDKWVDQKFRYILLALLGLYVVMFVIMLVVFGVGSCRGKNTLWGANKAIKIFKSLTKIVYFSITVVTMWSLYREGNMDAVEFSVFIASFIIALVQLVLTIATIITNISVKLVSLRFQVEVYRYVDGQRKKPTYSQRRKMKRYVKAERSRAARSRILKGNVTAEIMDDDDGHNGVK